MFEIIDDEYDGEEQLEQVYKEPTCPRCSRGCGYCLMLER